MLLMKTRWCSRNPPQKSASTIRQAFGTNATYHRVSPVSSVLHCLQLLKVKEAIASLTLITRPTRVTLKANKGLRNMRTHVL